MSKFLVETHYTCTFKIVHELDELNEKSLSDIDGRKDGKVEIIDVTVNNRKTKKAGSDKDTKKFEIKNNLKNENKSISKKTEPIKTEILNKVQKKVGGNYNPKKSEKRFQMPDRRKRLYSKGYSWRS